MTRPIASLAELQQRHRAANAQRMADMGVQRTEHKPAPAPIAPQRGRRAMKIVGLMPCRNEDWVLGLTARAALMWCDELVILNHASTDGTEDIIRGLLIDYSPGRVTELYVPSSTWEEMDQRQRTLIEARKSQATHIAIIDADEIISGNLCPLMRRSLNSLPSHGLLELPQICLRGSITQMHTNGIWAEQYTPILFADDPVLKWENAADGYAHHHRAPLGRPLRSFRTIRSNEGGIMHLQFLDDRRLRAKQCLYVMNEVIRWPGRKRPEEINRVYGYAVYGHDIRLGVLERQRIHGPQRFAEVPVGWWEPYRDLLQYLHPDSQPWQLAECQRLWAEHGASKFAGLDLFGVVG